MLPRDVGDDIFDEIMEEDQVPGWRRTLMWAGVRIFGWLSYGKREAGMREISLVLTILFAASGCVSLDKIIEAAGRDRASWCGRFVTGVGAGALVPGPGIPVGGYYGDVYVGRSNEPGSTVRVDSNGCEITHGKGG